MMIFDSTNLMLSIFPILEIDPPRVLVVGISMKLPGDAPLFEQLVAIRFLSTSILNVTPLEGSFCTSLCKTSAQAVHGFGHGRGKGWLARLCCECYC